MPINWKDAEAFKRLLAAQVAAQDMKLDYRKIAHMYGQGATYDAIEGRYRIIKKDAAELLAEAETGERPIPPARGSTSNTAKSSTTFDEDIATPKKPRAPRSATTTPRAKKTVGGNKVVGGRVTKSTESSPKKKNMTGAVVNGIKEEVSSVESSMEEFLEMGMDVESVAEGLGLGATSAFEGSFDTEV
ncbi:MAG: hypothetical protein Q9209_001289 [Squamulea sp. 1 TL-2023]